MAFYNQGESLLRLHRRLIAHFGPPMPCRLLDPVSQLIMGIIGGRTLSSESLRAFRVLLSRFDCWEQVCDAEPASLARSIAAVTDAEVKARRLRAALRLIVARRGRLELDFLADLSVEAALSWLESLPGVGRKVSAATLNFSTLRKKALVIDRHHLRILRRLGLVRPRANTAEAYRRIVPDLPDAWTAADLDDHHQLMKSLGQSCCRHAFPRCDACPLRDLCPARDSTTLVESRPGV